MASGKSGKKSSKSGKSLASSQNAASSNAGRFSNLFAMEHDAFLIRLKDNDAGTWSEIADLFNERFPPAAGHNARTSGGLQVRYSRNIKANIKKNKNYYKAALAALSAGGNNATGANNSNAAGLQSSNNAAAPDSTNQPSSSKQPTAKKAKSSAGKGKGKVVVADLDEEEADNEPSSSKQPPLKKSKLSAKSAKRTAADSEKNVGDVNFEALDAREEDAEDRPSTSAEKGLKRKRSTHPASTTATRQSARTNKRGVPDESEVAEAAAPPKSGLRIRLNVSGPSGKKSQAKGKDRATVDDAAASESAPMGEVVQGDATNQKRKIIHIYKARETTAGQQADHQELLDAREPTINDFQGPSQTLPLPLGSTIDPRTGAEMTTYNERQELEEKSKRSKWRPITREHLQSLIACDHPDVPLMFRRPVDNSFIMYNPVSNGLASRWRFHDDPVEYPSDPRFDSYDEMPRGVRAGDVPARLRPSTNTGQIFGAATRASATDRLAHLDLAQPRVGVATRASAAIRSASVNPTQPSTVGKSKGKSKATVRNDDEPTQVGKGKRKAAAFDAEHWKVKPTKPIKRRKGGRWPEAPKLTANANFQKDVLKFGPTGASQQYEDWEGNSKEHEPDEAVYNPVVSKASGADNEQADNEQADNEQVDDEQADEQQVDDEQADDEQADDEQADNE